MQIALARHVIVAAPAMRGLPAIFVYGKRVRVFLREPRRRRGGRRANHHRQVVVCGQLDSALQPAQAEGALARLQVGPGKFGHADDGEAGGAHQSHVISPALFGPMFRIPGSTQVQGHVVTPLLCVTHWTQRPCFTGTRLALHDEARPTHRCADFFIVAVNVASCEYKPTNALRIIPTNDQSPARLYPGRRHARCH